MKYQMELSERQAKIIKIALEEYFRLRMNQTWDFADSICFEGFDYKNHTDKDFNERIKRREAFKDELEKILNTFHPMQFTSGKSREKTIEMRMAIDIWQVIRNRIYLDKGRNPNGWCVDTRKPVVHLSEEPFPKMKEVLE